MVRHNNQSEREGNKNKMLLNRKTHKNRSAHGTTKKSELWKKLESFREEEREREQATTATAATVECVYNPSGNRELCDVCSSNIVITDDGFAT